MNRKIEAIAAVGLGTTAFVGKGELPNNHVNAAPQPAAVVRSLDVAPTYPNIVPHSLDLQVSTLPSVEAAMTDVVTDDFSFFNVPVTATNVEQARGEFKSTLRRPFDSLLAEPGVMLVGPDFPADGVRNSGGHIEYINPTNQRVIDGPDMNGRADGNILLQEGGFVVGSFQDGKLWFRWGANRENSIDIVIPQIEGRNTIALIRGLFGDGKQNTDRNQLIHIEGVIAGANLFMKYPKGGFISEGHMKQVFNASHTSGPNCGDGGCSELLVIGFDVNTGAAFAALQRQTDGPFEVKFSNFR